MPTVDAIDSMVLGDDGTGPARLRDIVIMVYGDKKVGKSTFAAQMPDAIFLDCEDGMRTVLDRSGKRPDRIVIRSLDDMRNAVKALVSSSKYDTVIVDGMNSLYNMVKRELYDEHHVQSMNEGPLSFGKGKEIVTDRFDSWFQQMKALDRGLVLIAHESTQSFNHNGVEFDKRIPFIDNTKDSVGWNIIKPSIDMILYAHKAMIDKELKHVMRTKGTPLVEAGDPYGALPEIMPLDYDELKNELGE